jgi:hypothetical protein
VIKAAPAKGPSFINRVTYVANTKAPAYPQAGANLLGRSGLNVICLKMRNMYFDLDQDRCCTQTTVVGAGLLNESLKWLRPPHTNINQQIFAK